MMDTSCLHSTCGKSSTKYFGGKEGARRRPHAVGCQMEQAECFNSSFDLLTIEPRKLRTGFNSGGCKSSKAIAAGVLSPCFSVDSMHSLCGSLSPSSPGTRLTNDKVVSPDDNIFCDTPTNIPPPKSPSGFPVKVTTPQYNESSGVTYEDADCLSPRQYGLYEMANVGLRASSHGIANQFTNLGICDEFQDSSTRPAARVATAALKDAHQETLQKAWNPETATRLDNMKASILCHGFYPRLVEAYISHRRVGASPEVKMRLRNLQVQLRDWRPPNMTDFNANEAVECNQNKFHSMIIAYEKDLETPFQNSMSFCYGLEKDLELMQSTTRATSPPICSLLQEQSQSELHDSNTLTRKPVWR